MWNFVAGLLAVYPGPRWPALSLAHPLARTVSYFLQRNTFAETRRQKEADKRDERRALGLNFFTKMMWLASTIETLRRSLDGAFARARIEKVKAPPWALISPLANLPSKIHFEPKELTEILRLDFALFNDIGPFDDLHNSLLDIFEMYRVERNSLTSTMKGQEMVGALGRAEFTPEEMKLLQPKMVALDSLIVGMVERTRVDAKEAWTLLQRLQDVLNKEYGLKLSLEIKPPPTNQ
ncbi:hypothetical protein ACTGJ9_025885 [Bradyrhizobium sp. RDM12]